VTSALSITVSSGSTLGTVSAQPQYVYVYALDNAGTVELAVSGQRIFDEGSLQTTTAEGGAGNADSGNVLYSTTARSNVPIRFIGRVLSTQSTAGTWATTPSEVTVLPSDRFKQKVVYFQANTGAGYGSSATEIRRFTNVVVNQGSMLSQSSTNGDIVTIPEDGVYAFTWCDCFNTTGFVGFSLNSSQTTTIIENISAADRIAIAESAAAGQPTCTQVTSFFKTGDIVRPHGDGSASCGAPERANFTGAKVQ
jgi:hypothetical protein